MRVRTHMYTHIRTHTRTHTHTHACTHAHTPHTHHTYQKGSNRPTSAPQSLQANSLDSTPWERCPILAVRGRNSLFTTSLGSLSTACRPVSSQALATSGGGGEKREGREGDKRKGEERREEGSREKGVNGKGREASVMLCDRPHLSF